MGGGWTLSEVARVLVGAIFAGFERVRLIWLGGWDRDWFVSDGPGGFLCSVDGELTVVFLSANSALAYACSTRCQSAVLLVIWSLGKSPLLRGFYLYSPIQSTR